MATKFTPFERREFAQIAGVDQNYIYMCIAGIRDMDAGRAKQLEAATKKRIRVWDLCPNRWHEIWPELMKDKNAPAPKPAAEVSV